jgi:hypothetical protein
LLARAAQKRGHVFASTYRAVTVRERTSEERPSLEAEAAVAIERVCASALFQKAPVLRELLLFLWHSRKNSKSEYHIGTEVLGRRPDFDPKIDATVRVNIARLRQRLSAYYDTEGADSPVRFSIPVGVHSVEFARVDNPQENEAPEKSRWAIPWRAIAVTSLTVCLVLAGFLYRMAQKGERSTPALHPFWELALRSGTAYNLIMPSPQFFRWRQHNFVARDFGVNDHEQISKSPSLEALRQRWGEPETSQLYTVTTDTLAAGEIARHLQDRGISVDIHTRSTVPPALLEERDAILMFAPTTAAQYERSIQPLSFRFEPGGITNLRPAPGEPGRWVGRSYAQDHSLTYGILAMIPSRTGATRQVLLVSNQNNALAALITSTPGLRVSFEYWKAHGSPEFFEMVIQYEFRGLTALRAEPVAIHAWADNQPLVSSSD